MKRDVLLFKKLRFYNQNKLTIDALGRLPGFDWSNKDVRSLVNKARVEVGYSSKTAPCDIYSALCRLTPSWEERRKTRWKRL